MSDQEPALAAHDAPGLAEAVEAELDACRCTQQWSGFDKIPFTNRLNCPAHGDDHTGMRRRLRALLAAHPPTAPEPSAGADGLAGLLAEHVMRGEPGILSNGKAWIWRCVCDHEQATATRSAALKTHRAHVAAVLTGAGYGLVSEAEAERDRLRAAVERVEALAGELEAAECADLRDHHAAYIRAALEEPGQ